MRARPPCSPELLRSAVEVRNCTNGSLRTLKFAVIAGQVTETFVAKGTHVMTIESDSECTRCLAVRLHEGKMQASMFETAEMFEIYMTKPASATAFHWLDLDVALAKLHRILVPHELLAMRCMRLSRNVKEKRASRVPW